MSNALGDESSTQAGEILSEQVMSLIKESPRLKTRGVSRR
jgi:putative transposase